MSVVAAAGGCFFRRPVTVGACHYRWYVSFVPTIVISFDSHQWSQQLRLPARLFLWFAVKLCLALLLLLLQPCLLLLLLLLLLWAGLLLRQPSSCFWPSCWTTPSSFFVYLLLLRPSPSFVVHLLCVVSMVKNSWHFC